MSENTTSTTSCSTSGHDLKHVAENLLVQFDLVTNKNDSINVRQFMSIIQLDKGVETRFLQRIGKIPASELNVSETRRAKRLHEVVINVFRVKTRMIEHKMDAKSFVIICLFCCGDDTWPQSDNDTIRLGRVSDALSRARNDGLMAAGSNHLRTLDTFRYLSSMQVIDSFLWEAHEVQNMRAYLKT